ncbi:small acid-soluble spore protein P [Alkalibacillus sp. S2W]
MENLKGLNSRKNQTYPKSPKQPYGKPMQGSHKVKQHNHSGQKQKTDHDM